MYRLCLIPALEEIAGIRIIGLLPNCPEKTMARFIVILLGLLPVFGWPEPVDNFVLLDQHGKNHDLYDHKNKAAVVIMIQGNGCPIVRNAVTDYRELRDQYQGRDVHFMMLNANLQDQPSAILREAETFGIDWPILHDRTQAVGRSLNLIRTAEVLVIDPETWDIAYRGPINDRQVYERQKAEASNHFAAAAIDSVLKGESVDVPYRDTLGCLIYFAKG
jgi:peroxiredoxin